MSVIGTLTLLVTASLFSISHSLHRGSGFSRFTLFLLFLLRQSARGLCRVSVAGERVLTFRRLEKGPRLPTVTGSRLRVCAWDPFSQTCQQQSSHRAPEAWFPLSLPSWDYLLEVVLSFPAGWKEGSLQIKSYLLCTLSCAGGHLCGRGQRWEGVGNAPWQHPQVPGSLTWSRGLHCSEESHEDRGTSWWLRRRTQLRSCCPNRSSLPFLFSVLQHSPCALPASALLCAGASQSRTCQKVDQPNNRSAGSLIHDSACPFSSQRSRGGAGGWRTGGTTLALSQQKAALKPRVLRQRESKTVHRGERERAAACTASSVAEARAASPSLSWAGRFSLKEKKCCEVSTLQPVFIVWALSSIKARHMDLPRKLNRVPRT